MKFWLLLLLSAASACGCLAAPELPYFTGTRGAACPEADRVACDVEWPTCYLQCVEGAWMVSHCDTMNCGSGLRVSTQ